MSDRCPTAQEIEATKTPAGGLVSTICRFRGHGERCFMEPEVGDGATEIHAGV